MTLIVNPNAPDAPPSPLGAPVAVRTAIVVDVMKGNIEVLERGKDGIEALAFSAAAGVLLYRELHPEAPPITIAIPLHRVLEMRW